LVVACFNSDKVKPNLAAMSAIGPARLFGRVLCNVLEDNSQSKFGTRMITVHPIKLSVAQSPLKGNR
jgi:hypothetical protein